MKKKIISLLLVLIMIISVMPIIFAEETMALEEKVTTAGLENFKKQMFTVPERFRIFSHLIGLPQML